MTHHTFAPGDAVMVACASGPTTFDNWFVGIVNKPTDPRYGWTQATVKNSPNGSTFIIPGWPADRIRPATAEDLAALPDWAREWFDLQMLDRRDPRVPLLTKQARVALRTAGVHRLSDLRAASDEQILALKGVGQKAVLQLREWQRSSEQTTLVGEVQ